MKVVFINGNVLTCPMEARLGDSSTIGSRIEGPDKVNGRPIRALVYDSNHHCALWH